MLQEHKTFYDKRWSNPEVSVLSGIRLRRAVTILDEISRLNLERPRILDLGCGSGILSGLLSAVGEVTGLDLSSHASEVTSKEFPRVQYLAGDLFGTELPVHAFDVVILQEVIEHVNDQAGLIALCHERLKPGGYLILTTPNADVAERSGKMRTAKTNDRLQPIENLLTVSETRRLVQKYLDLVRCYTILPCGHTGLLRLINSPTLLRLPGWESLRSKLNVGLHTVVVAQRR